MNQQYTKLRTFFSRASLIGTVAICSLSLYIYFFQYVPPILMYHHVHPVGSDTSKITVHPSEFERQMAYLHEHHYNIITIDEIMRLHRNNKKLPSKTLAITFDDGYENNYTYAFPILKKYGFPATIFLTVGLIGTKNRLSWKQVQEMEQAGISFGNHTMTHPNLEHSLLSKTRAEVTQSNTILNKHLKAQSQIFSYPFGAYSPEVAAFIEEIGYAGAVASNPSGVTALTDPYGFKRVRISSSSNNLAVFWFESSGYYALMCQLRKKIKHARKMFPTLLYGTANSSY